MNLQHLSNDDLLAGLSTLVASQRIALARLIAHLSEIEHRRLHVEAGFSSMFESCVKHLRMSEGEAYRRILASRLARRFASIYDLLASGAVHLSALALLRGYLTQENHAELLLAASGKSKREVELLLAARFPKPDVPTTLRKLPARSGSRPTTAARPALESKPLGQRASRANGAQLEPLSESRFKLQLTVSASLRDKLELARDLMSHANPGRELSVVVERALDLLLADLQKKRLCKTKRPRTAVRAQRPKPPSAQARAPEGAAQTASDGSVEAEPQGHAATRGAAQAASERIVEPEPEGHAAAKRAARTASERIANAERRAVYQRDGLQCGYVSPDGRRCSARAFLELDHAVPHALGGSSEAINLRVRCRAHNQLWAEQVYGREYLERCKRERCKRFRRRKSAGERATPRAGR